MSVVSVVLACLTLLVYRFLNWSIAFDEGLAEWSEVGNWSVHRLQASRMVGRSRLAFKDHDQLQASFSR